MDQQLLDVLQMFVIGVLGIAAGAVSTPFVTAVVNLFKWLLPLVGIKLSGQMTQALVVLVTWVVVAVATKAGFGEQAAAVQELLAVVIAAVANLLGTTALYNQTAGKNLITGYKRS